ncbi:uncharacterized protein LOC144573269 isoform X3 [Carex rostrata]
MDKERSLPSPIPNPILLKFKFQKGRRRYKTKITALIHARITHLSIRLFCENGVHAWSLENGFCCETPKEEINDEKTATQLLRKGFLDADEANLLEEEDMHVFGCKPMADPLHLVCCNCCKKPVRASQYTTHAERCNPLTFKRDSPSGINNEVKAKKPPRKGKKASERTTSGNQNASIGVKAKKEIADEICVSGLAMGVENSLSSVSGRGSTVTMHEPDDIKFSSTSSRGVPHPLATKIYHCQRNSQLRFELSQIYYGACEDGYRGNCPNLASIENGVVNPHATPCINSLHGAENNSFVRTKFSNISAVEIISKGSSRASSS